MRQFLRLQVFVLFSLCGLLSTSAKGQTIDNLALDLDGNNDFISLSPLPAAFANNTNFTIETWFYANPPGGGPGCLGNFSALLSLFDPISFVPQVFEIGMCNGGQLHYYYANGGLSLPTALSITDYSGACHHLAVTRSGSQFEVFVDGTSIFVGSFGNNPFNVTHFYVGGGTGWTGWAGQVDEVRLWRVARTLQEIKDHKDCSLSGSSTGLEVNWPFDFDGATAYGGNTAITQTLDAAATPTLENGMLNGFNLSSGSLNSNYVASTCTPRYLLDISDQISLFPISLAGICAGDNVHFCVTDNGNAINLPAGGMVMWESSEGNAPWTPDPDLLNYAPASNALCFPVKAGTITSSNCNMVSPGYTDRWYRAKILKKMGNQTCTYTSAELPLRICCPPTCGNIAIAPSLQPPWCEGDNVSMTVFLNPCDPWLAFGFPNVTIDWCLIDGGIPTPLPQFQNQLAFTLSFLTIGQNDICLQAKISNCICPPIVVEKCFDVDPLPVCGAITVHQPSPTPITQVGVDRYVICPGDYAILEMVNPAQFQHCTPVWQYIFDTEISLPVPPWKNWGTSNPSQNTNTLPQLNPLAPGFWPPGANCIYYRIECRPESWPNSGCDPCHTNIVEICLQPPPPSGVISGPTQYCENDPFPTLTITTNPPPTGPLTYCWYWNGVLEQCLPDPINTYTISKPGCYRVEITDGCQSVKVGPHCVEECVVVPIIKCPTDNPCACDGLPITLDGCDSYDTCNELPLTYSWLALPSGDTGTGCTFTQTPSPTGETYYLTVTNALGCSKTSKPLFIKPCN